VTGQWYVRSDGNKVLFGTSSSCVGRKDARQWLASIVFLILANLDWVGTRQRQIDLLKKCRAESSRVHGHAPLPFQYVPHSTAAVTAFPFRFRHFLGSMRASMQGLGCVRNIYQQVAYFDLCQSEKREV